MILETTLGDTLTGLWSVTIVETTTTIATIKFYVAERNMLKLRTSDISAEYALNELVSTRSNVHRTCHTVNFL